jgi:5'-deoxynucleotidase YfbR-like HD superfamily hydrolase
MHLFDSKINMPRHADVIAIAPDAGAATAVLAGRHRRRLGSGSSVRPPFPGPTKGKRARITRMSAKKPPSGGARRAWQRMLSGRRLDLLDPSPLDVEIEDIAQGLSRVARWNGQTVGEWAFSVAQHSLLVEQIAGRFRPAWPPRWRLATLLHDAPEYVVGDLITPFKAAVGRDYKDLEARLMTAIHLRFSLPGELPKEVSATIKRADVAAAFLEATQLAGFGETEARRFFGRPRGLPRIVLTPWPPVEAQRRFLQRYRHLAHQMGL